MLGAHSPRDSWARCIDLKSARAGAAPECSLFDGGRKKGECVCRGCLHLSPCAFLTQSTRIYSLSSGRAACKAALAPRASIYHATRNWFSRVAREKFIMRRCAACVFALSADQIWAGACGCKNVTAPAAAAAPPAYGSRSFGAQFLVIFF
jgi:hypothetical protein